MENRAFTKKPFSNYPNNLPLRGGINFLTGPNEERFEVNEILLIHNSPAILQACKHARRNHQTIRLPDVSKDDLSTLFRWIREKEPPVYKKPEQLKDLCRLWMLASKLGFWKQQNTLLRLGMELMQPKDYKCDIETVHYVYENISKYADIKLCKFIIAVFCQRSRVEAHFFTPRYEALGILRDAAQFLEKLERVRRRRPVGKDGYDLDAEFRREWGTNEWGWPVVNYLITGDKIVDWSRVEYRLPEYLVWGEKGEDLPDCFFVDEEEAMEEAREVVEQIQ